MRRLFACCLLLGLPSCGLAPDRDAVQRGTARAPDGVPIVYDVRGVDGPTLVFVHCWACDRSFWKEQLDVFARDHRVVSLDLAGHGESGTDRELWTLASLAEDVKAVADALELERFTLVGHSMGGPVSLEAARLMPHRVSAIVCVDTLHNAELIPPQVTANQILEGLRADFRDAMGAMVASGFPEDADPALVDWVRDNAVEANPEAAIGLIRALLEVDLKSLFSGVSVPIRCINSSAGFETAVDTNRQYADFKAVVLETGGHFLHLEDPESFNASLATTLSELP